MGFGFGDLQLQKLRPHNAYYLAAFQLDARYITCPSLRKYNQAAARVMKKHGVPTLDLFTPSKTNMKDWMKEANVHYHAHGSQALAERVAGDILKRIKN